MRTRVKGWTRTKQANELHISLATLDRIIRRLKLKYDAAQKHHTDVMPERKESAEELYMDSN